MRQQFFNAAVEMRRQALEHISEVDPGVVTVHLRRLQQAHDDSGALSRQFAASEPIAPLRNGLS